MLSPELETRAFLGRPVVDIYGRSLGRVIGIERNAFGELEGVQVEASGGHIVSAKARQLGLTPKIITLTPDWKLEAVDIISELMSTASSFQSGVSVIIFGVSPSCLAFALTMCPPEAST